MPSGFTRRDLLSRAGHVGAGLAVAAASRDTLAQYSPRGANDRIGIGIIGCGQRGTGLTELLLLRDDVAIRVICDVNSKRAEALASRIEKAERPRPDIVVNHEELLDRQDVEGVVIATPDHWHALQLVHACLAGKDAYVEAPLTYSPSEGPLLTHVVRKYRRVVQVGMQLRSAAWFDEAVLKIRTGGLGRIAQTRTWAFLKAKPIPESDNTDPPEHLDYDRWIGPSLPKPYNPHRVENHWHNWWDYGGGMTTRWNVHLQDAIQWGMRVNVPTSVVAVGGNMGLKDFRETPDTLEAVFEYQTLHGPLAGKFVHTWSLRMNNGHAGWGPPMAGHNGQLPDGTTLHYGSQFHGEKATLFLDRERMAEIPNRENQPEALTGPEHDEVSHTIDLLASTHLDDFLVCLRSRNEPKAPVEAGYYAALPCHLANVAYRTGRKLYFDPRESKLFTDAACESPDHEANELLQPQRRAPYLPPAI